MKPENVRIHLLVDGLHGINCWKRFAENYPQIVEKLLSKEDAEILANPEHEHHNDVISTMEGRIIKNDDGSSWLLMQNDSIFVVSKDDIDKLSDEDTDKFWENFSW